MVHTGLGILDKTAVLQAIALQPNVYAETSWTNPESILQAMAVLDSSRTLFGTDATVDGWAHFTNQSIADPAGAYTYSIPETVAAVRAAAHPAAFENWARLTATRLYGLRFAGLL
jgi:predicted TIM-barrel fold metal-dependent hydrolase